MQNLNFWETAYAFGGGVLVILMFIAQVSPEQAISNTSRWLCSALGIQNPPQWLASPNTDRVVRNGAQIGMAVLVIAGVFLFVDVGKMQTGPKLLLIVGALAVLGSVGWHVGQSAGLPSGVQSLSGLARPADKWAGTAYAGLDHRDQFSFTEVACYWAGIPLVKTWSDYDDEALRNPIMANIKEELVRGVTDGYLNYYDFYGHPMAKDDGKSNDYFKRADLIRFFNAKSVRPPFLFEDAREPAKPH